MTWALYVVHDITLQMKVDLLINFTHQKKNNMQLNQEEDIAPAQSRGADIQQDGKGPAKQLRGFTSMAGILRPTSERWRAIT